MQVKKELEQIKSNLQSEEKVYKQTKQAFEQKEQAWVNGQAGLLAEHLHEGEPCPVCGSTEHPHKAEIAIHTPTKKN
ncbi:hypothetical protein [Piscibacillus salipiscarius]|uniref:hypothetical protein n=1 Tax=Piscibacillus salipiscarius TaxID=299480 RepID=UPI0006D0BF67|nr:hypothetical protein [Piscibacillus salipiscarius]